VAAVHRRRPGGPHRGRVRRRAPGPGPCGRDRWPSAPPRGPCPAVRGSPVNVRVRLILLAVALAAAASILLLSYCAGPTGTSSHPAQSAPAPASQSPSIAVSDDDGGDDGAADTKDAPGHITAGPADASEAAIQVVVKLLNTTGKTPERWRNELRP